MIESGWYPPGAEFDPQAPYNQIEFPELEFELTAIIDLRLKTNILSSNIVESSPVSLIKEIKNLTEELIKQRGDKRDWLEVWLFEISHICSRPWQESILEKEHNLLNYEAHFEIVLNDSLWSNAYDEDGFLYDINKAWQEEFKTPKQIFDKFNELVCKIKLESFLQNDLMKRIDDIMKLIELDWDETIVEIDYTENLS